MRRSRLFGFRAQDLGFQEPGPSDLRSALQRPRIHPREGFAFWSFNKKKPGPVPALKRNSCSLWKVGESWPRRGCVEVKKTLCPQALETSPGVLFGFFGFSFSFAFSNGGVSAPCKWVGGQANKRWLPYVPRHQHIVSGRNRSGYDGRLIGKHTWSPACSVPSLTNPVLHVGWNSEAGSRPLLKKTNFQGAECGPWPRWPMWEPASKSLGLEGLRVLGFRDTSTAAQQPPCPESAQISQARGRQAYKGFR